MGDRPPPPPPPPPVNTLVHPSSSKKRHKQVKVLRAFRNVFRSLPIITPVCKLPSLPGGRLPDGKSGSTIKVTGTIFGYRKGRASLSIQENPRTLPMMVVELAMQTQALQKELSLGMLRIAMECEKPPVKDKCSLLDEPVWTMFSNGKKNGYSRRREATDEDLRVMEVLKAMSMGTGVLPQEDADDEMTYMRWQFDRMVGSKNSETFYVGEATDEYLRIIEVLKPMFMSTGVMSQTEDDNEMAYMRWQFNRVVGSYDSEILYVVSPNGGTNCPDLSIFFVWID